MLESVAATTPHPLVIRPAEPDDADAVEALHDRCSDETLYRRFHSAVPRVPVGVVHQMLQPVGGWSVLVVSQDTVVGFACAAPVSASEVEVGMLVDDRHQRRGIGTRLLHELSAGAAERGYQGMECHTLPDNTAVLATLRRAGMIGRVAWRDGLLQISIPVRRLPPSDLQ